MIEDDCVLELYTSKAFVVLREVDPASPELARELQGFVKNRITQYKHPRHMEFVSALPKRAAGKLLRYKLRELASGTFATYTPGQWTKSTQRSDNISAESWLSASLVCLQRAVLCANCEIISEGNKGHCAACGSEALLRLSEVIGGPLESELGSELCPATPMAGDMIGGRFCRSVACRHRNAGTRTNQRS